jgi:hypothetical protein
MHILYVAARNLQFRPMGPHEDMFCVFKYMIYKRNSVLKLNVGYRTQQARSPLFVPVNQSSQQSYPQACGKLRNLKNNPQVSVDCDVSL